MFEEVQRGIVQGQTCMPLISRTSRAAEIASSDQFRQSFAMERAEVLLIVLESFVAKQGCSGTEYDSVRLELPPELITWTDLAQRERFG